MIKGDAEYMGQIAATYVCAYHKTPVVVAWHAMENCYVLRCDTGTHKELAPLKSGEAVPQELIVPGHYPEEVTRLLPLTQAYKAGEEIDEPIKSNIEKGIRRRQMQQDKQPTAVTFQGLPATDLGTGELLTLEVVKALAAYAKKYDLDPARGHVLLMYSKPYITIDGYLYHANKSKQPYSLDSRPLEEDELKQYRAPDNAHVWLSRVKMTDTGQEFVGYGIVTQEEMAAKSPRDANKLRSPVVAAHPWQLAQKRAEWQALRRAFPIGETEEKEEE